MLSNALDNKVESDLTENEKARKGKATEKKRMDYEGIEKNANGKVWVFGVCGVRKTTAPLSGSILRYRGRP